ncbi:pilus assembly protein [Vibrio astriarenae]|uniref:Pilus assembly protein n=2 Tax=Vibrio astriarenae TaxID=1481923 RepID=A0A7Z2YF33_9VIBR|nr:pilus assembly protein [Vibrio astriarenae]
MVTMAMIGVLGVVALAVDVNHALLNKTRLQNGVDAAALAGAVVLDSGGSPAQATTAINETLTNVTNASGNDEMTFSSGTLIIQYSNDPRVFPDSDYTVSDDSYVRVSVSSFPLEDFFAGIFGIAKDIDASAVAGPSPGIEILQNVVPIAVCSGGEGLGATGYLQDKIYALKMASQQQSEMGPGNFQLLDFGSGAATIRDALAGGYEGEIDISEDVTTKPGGSVGPVGQGLNTRFNVYEGGGVNSSDYPPDIYTKEPVTKATLDSAGEVVYEDTTGADGNPWMYSDYLSELGCNTDNTGACTCTAGSANCTVDQGGQPDRRILPVPIVNCDSADGGTSTYSIEAIGCFFMLQQAPTSNSGKEPVFGEFIEDCTVTGGTPGDNSSDEGPYRIVLYEDPYSEDS